MAYMATEQFSAKYSGPALDDHTMDAMTLGPALLAMGEMFRETYRVADPMGEKEPTIRVQQVRAGSFEVVLSIDLSVIEHVKTLFSGSWATAAANVITIGGATFHAVNHLVRITAATISALKAEASEQGRPSKDTLVNELHDEILADLVDKLRDERQFRNHLAKVTKPATQEGIDNFTIRTQDGHELVSVDTYHAEYFNAAALTEETPQARIEEATIKIGTPQIEKPLRRKWGIIHDEYGTVNAALLDQEFANDVVHGKVSFGAGREFRAKLRVEETLTGQIEHKRNFEIIEIQAITGGEQLTLD